MAMFQMKWLRKLVRRHTTPLPMSTAQLWKQRLSIAYAVLAWNAFGFVLYACFTGRADWAKAAGLKSQEEINMSPGKSLLFHCVADDDECIINSKYFSIFGKVSILSTL